MLQAWGQKFGCYILTSLLNCFSTKHGKPLVSFSLSLAFSGKVVKKNKSEKKLKSPMAWRGVALAGVVDVG
jgi:hypothetical protein